MQMPMPSAEDDARLDSLMSVLHQTKGDRKVAVMERVLDVISFEAPERKGEQITVDAAYVQKMLSEIVKDQDLSRYIL